MKIIILLLFAFTFSVSCSGPSKAPASPPANPVAQLETNLKNLVSQSMDPNPNTVKIADDTVGILTSLKQTPAPGLTGDKEDEAKTKDFQTILTYISKMVESGKKSLSEKDGEMAKAYFSDSISLIGKLKPPPAPQKK